MRDRTPERRMARLCFVGMLVLIAAAAVCTREAARHRQEVAHAVRQ